MSDLRPRGFFDRLKDGLAKTRKVLLTDIDDLVLGEKKLDDDLLEHIEEALIGADVGPAFSAQLLDRIRKDLSRKDLTSADVVHRALRDTMLAVLAPCEAPLTVSAARPHVVMVVGVNGTGKTTTIGKLTAVLSQQGHRVMLAAADTFRAAAIEQLEVWSRRNNVPLIRQAPGADPSAVVFDAVQAAKAAGTDVLVVDTAGRLHTKVNLMEELKKMTRILGREIPGAPHEVLLVVDATTGQNGLAQARMFREEAGVTGIVLTKLDGTAKGGIILRIAGDLGIPIRYIGIGEGIEDLRPFRAAEFVDAIVPGSGA